ncbi:MAG TPA: tRNA guanosine(34) transglycosylase Tgt, partial [Acidimicrobiales bacterium]|nr:tRNA guanosine(34) transglycosylase Tgt [Acidimicrobiales bacterium]
MDEIRAEQDAGAAIFGIVQGGDDVRLRKRSAESTVAIGFDGYGIGGLSVGEPPDVRTEALDTALEMLPRNLPRYLMGVGDPVGLLEAISSGVDMFDCVLPTRLARHGTLLTDEGKVHLKRAEFARDSSPIDRLCGCKVCSRWSRAYLRHLLMVGDPTFQRLASIHNLYWMFDLLARARSAISSGNLTHLISGMKEAFLSAEPISDEP